MKHILGQSDTTMQRAFHWVAPGMGKGFTSRVAGLLKVECLCYGVERRSGSAVE